MKKVAIAAADFSNPRRFAPPDGWEVTEWAFNYAFVAQTSAIILPKGWRSFVEKEIAAAAILGKEYRWQPVSVTPIEDVPFDIGAAAVEFVVIQRLLTWDTPGNIEVWLALKPDGRVVYLTVNLDYMDWAEHITLTGAVLIGWKWEQPA